MEDGPDWWNDWAATTAPRSNAPLRDNVSIEVDAVVYWQLLEHSRAYYAVDNLQAAMVNLVLTQIRTEMGKLDLDQTFTTPNEANETKCCCANSIRPPTPGGQGHSLGDAGHRPLSGGATHGTADDR